MHRSVTIDVLTAGPIPPSPDAPPVETLSRPRQFLVAIYVVVSFWYLLWRPDTFNAAAPWFSRLVYAGEVFGFVTALLHIHMVWRLSVREAPPAQAGLVVDVYVTTRDEPVEMLRRTLLAVNRMSYPHVTWLLDDGNRPAMRALAAELGVQYLARGRHQHAKAGNLNHALARTLGDFIAVFDADHAPARDFLTRTLGYFRDKRVAFVSTPQDFYNLDSYQHHNDAQSRLVWNEQSLFFRVIQRGKDTTNSAFFCGTCGVLRRRALDDIGGFAVDTVTEDLDTSVRIHRKGWRSVYHGEPLAFGIAAADFVPFVRQRVRWGQGAMQVLRRHRFLLFASGLTLPQRLNYFASTIMYFDGWQKALFYLAPGIVLVTGAMPISELSWDFVWRFVPYYLLTFWVFEEVGRGYGRALDVERYNMARYGAFVWSTLGLLRRRLTFRVTQKQRVPDADHANRRFLWPQWAVLGMNAAAIPLGLLLQALGVIALPAAALIANIFWALVNVVLARAVVGFTQRLSGFHRREYRFRIPLPALLSGDSHHPYAGILDDVSADGFKYYGRFPENTAPGDSLTGEILLPEGRLTFRATVCACFPGKRDGDVRALGCRFDWAAPRDADALIAFLYGSDLQWKLNRLSDRSRTPLERLLRWIRRPSRPTPDAPTDPWAAAVVRNARAPGGMLPGIVSVPTDPRAERTLVVFERMGARERLEILVTTRAGTSMLRTGAILFDAMLAGGTPLYLYRLRPAGML